MWAPSSRSASRSSPGPSRYKFAALRPRLTLVLLAALAAALLLAPEASADLLTPESGPSENANDIDTLYKITLYMGLVIFLLVESRPHLLADQVPRAQGRARARSDSRQHAARDLVDDRRGAHPRRPRRGDLHLPARHQGPARLARGRARARRRLRLRDDQPEGAAGRQGAAHPRDRPAVPLALRLRGPGGPALQLPHAVRAGEHDGHHQGLLVRRRPLLVGAQARREDRRDPGPRERDLVPRGRGGRLRGRLRRALRRGPRRHAHASGRPAGGRVRGVGGAAGSRHQGGPGRAWPSSARNARRADPEDTGGEG